MTAGIGRTIGDDHRADREQMAIRDAVPNHAQRAGAGVAGRRLTERAVAHRRATRRGTRPRHDVEGGGDAEHRRGGIDHVDGAADRADVAARVGDLIAQRVATGAGAPELQARKATFAPHWAGSASTTMFAGTDTDGGVFTVRVAAAENTVPHSLVNRARYWSPLCDAAAAKLSDPPVSPSRST